MNNETMKNDEMNELKLAKKQNAESADRVEHR